MSHVSVTTYQETAALFAVLNGDVAEARRIVDDMYPVEREMFADQLTALRNLVAFAQQAGAASAAESARAAGQTGGAADAVIVDWDAADDDPDAVGFDDLAHEAGAS